MNCEPETPAAQTPLQKSEHLGSRPRTLGDRLLGADVFVSYAWDDGAEYSATLVDELGRRGGYTCFLDRRGMTAGEQLDPTIARHLRRASVLVVIATQQGVRSPWVMKEVRQFDERYVIPILFGDVLDRLEPADEMRRILGARLWIAESGEARSPSETVLAELLRAFAFRRKSVTRGWLARGAASVFFLIAAVAVVAGFYARAQSQRAVSEAENARQKTWTAQTRLAANQFAAAEAQWSEHQDRARALLLLSEALETAPVDDPRRAAYATRAMHAVLHGPRVSAGLGDFGDRVALSPSATLAAVVAATGGLTVVDLDSLSVTRRLLPSTGGKFVLAAFDPASRRVAALEALGGHGSMMITVADILGSGAPERLPLTIHNASDLAFSSNGDGLLLYERAPREQVIFIDLANPHDAASIVGLLPPRKPGAASEPGLGPRIPPHALSPLFRPGWSMRLSDDARHPRLLTTGYDEHERSYVARATALDQRPPRTLATYKLERPAEELAIASDGGTGMAIVKSLDGRACSLVRWDLVTGERVGAHVDVRCGSRFVDRSAAGKSALLVVAPPDAALWVVNLETGGHVAIPIDPSHADAAVAIPRIGSFVAAVSRTGDLRVWDTQTGLLRIAPEPLVAREEFGSRLAAVTISEATGRISYVSEDRTLMQWNPLGGEYAREGRLDLPVRVDTAAIDAAAGSVVTATNGETSATLRLWDVTEMRAVLRGAPVPLPGQVESVLFALGAKRIAALSWLHPAEDATIVMFDADQSGARRDCAVAIEGRDVHLALTDANELVAAWHDGDTQAIRAQRWTLPGCKPAWSTPVDKGGAAIVALDMSGTELILRRELGDRAPLEVWAVAALDHATPTGSIGTQTSLPQDALALLLRQVTEVSFIRPSSADAGGDSRPLALLPGARLLLPRPSIAEPIVVEGDERMVALPPLGGLRTLLFTRGAERMVARGGVAQVVRDGDELGARLVVFDTSIAAPIAEPFWDEHAVRAVALRANDNELAVVTSDGRLRVWPVMASGDAARWLRLAGPAITGHAIQADRQLVRLELPIHRSVRQEFLREIAAADAAGDATARLVRSALAGVPDSAR